MKNSMTDEQQAFLKRYGYYPGRAYDYGAVSEEPVVKTGDDGFYTKPTEGVIAYYDNQFYRQYTHDAYALNSD